MTGPELLRQHVGLIRSRVGAAFLGSHAIFRGHQLHAGLGDQSWMAVYILGITGRRFSDAQLRLLEAIWAYTSYPDSRIWNNRVAALAGTTRSTGALGVAAALAVSEAAIYGGGINIRAIDFLHRTRAELDAGGQLEPWVRNELGLRRSLGGYGRPVTSADERNEPIVALARSLGLGDGPYLKLAFDIEACLLACRYRLHINYGGVAAALGADLGLSPREYGLYTFPVFLAGMPPCYLDAADRPEGSLLPVPCDHVVYEGAARRRWTER
jgi:hypothetical protein